MKKRALLIGFSKYRSGFDPLPCVEKDLIKIKEILEKPDLGSFDQVKVCLNSELEKSSKEIEKLFRESGKDDVLLLYFSGHGFCNEFGRFYFATSSTEKDSSSTAIAARSIHEFMEDSRCQQQILILDCCFSGSFAKGLKLKSNTAVLFSSGLLEYSKQGNELSTYTQFLVEGIQTGDADQDKDGKITVDELSAYIKQRVIETGQEGIKPSISSSGDRIQLSWRPQPSCQTDWGDAPDLNCFFGRNEELTTLEKWILQDKCRLVAILGMKGIGKTRLLLGGIGKTDLSLKLAEKIKKKFRYVIWKSLLSAPSVSEVITNLVHFLSDQNETNLPTSLDGMLSRLIYYLRQNRCLIILDNFESVLCSGALAGDYKESCEGYHKLLSIFGEIDHGSCLIITSREKPKTVANFEGERSPVRSFFLKGLDNLSGKKIFGEIGDFSALKEDWENIINMYNGNPLALELAARHIKVVFDGNVHSFLESHYPVFEGMQDLLKWHFDRLDDAEKEVVYWLTINREPVTLDELKKDILAASRKRRLTSTIQLLQRRLPLEKSGSQFSLQPVLIEYCIERLISKIADEIRSKEVDFLQTYALVKASAKDFVRETQVKVIVNPLIQELEDFFGSREKLNCQLLSILEKRRKSYREKIGYIAGNIANILCCMGSNLNGLIFSGLIVRQAYLKNANLLNVDFSYADLDTCAFAEDFTYMNSVSFNPDGTLLATGDNSGEIRLWRLADGDQILRIREHTDWIQSIAFSSDGKFLVSSSGDTTLKIWAINDANNILCIHTLRGHQGFVSSGRFSPDGKLIVSGSDDTTLKIWDVSTGKCIRSLEGHDGSVMSVRFSPNGQYVISGSRDTTVRIWSVYTGTCLHNLKGHTGLIMSVAWSPNGDLVASASEDNTIKIWSVHDAHCLHTLRGHTNWAWAVAFSPDGLLLASGSVDSTLKLWDVKEGKPIRTFQGHKSRIWSIAFSPLGTLIASAGDDVTVRIWDVFAGGCLKTLQGYANPVSCIAFSPDGKTLASSNGDLTLKLWDFQTGRFKTITGQKQGGGSVAFSPNGCILVSSDGDLLKFWDVKTGSLRKEFRGHEARAESVAFSPDGKSIASSSCDHTVRLWNFNTGKSSVFSGHTDWVWSVAFSIDGKTLASGSDDRKVILWDIETKQFKSDLKGHTSRVRSVAFHPYNKSLLASCGDDKTIKLWNIETNSCLYTLEHKGEVRSITFSSDGETLASGSNDGSVKLWNIQTGKFLKSLEGHTGALRCLAFHPDGYHLASSTGSGDQSIRIWNIQSGKCLNIFTNPRPYEGMNITDVKGLTIAQKETLRALGAVENSLDLSQ